MGSDRRSGEWRQLKQLNVMDLSPIAMFPGELGLAFIAVVILRAVRQRFHLMADEAAESAFRHDQEGFLPRIGLDGRPDGRSGDAGAGGKPQSRTLISGSLDDP